MKSRFFAACAVQDCEAIASILATLQLSSSPVFLERDFAGSAESLGKSGASIRKAIVEAPKVIVIWSRHASADARVRAHWKQALAAGLPILIVKLDGTSLPSDLEECRALDFTGLAVESLEEQDDLLGEYVLTAETREFWYRLRGEESTFGPAPDFFEAWVHGAFALAGVFLAFGTGKISASPAWISLAVGLAIGIVFGPLLAHEVARYRARREMDRWLLATLRLYHDPIAERLRQADDRWSLSPLEAAALLHEQLRA